MKTRSQIIKQKFTITIEEAAKALLELKKACGPVTRSANTYPSGRPRRSTAGVVDYSE